MPEKPQNSKRFDWIVAYNLGKEKDLELIRITCAGIAIISASKYEYKIDPGMSIDIDVCMEEDKAVVDYEKKPQKQ